MILLENTPPMPVSTESMHGGGLCAADSQVESVVSDNDSTDFDSDEDSEDFSDVQKVDILELFNSSTQDDLCDIPGCSVAKSKLLVKCRPFEAWLSLVRSLFC